MAVFQAIHWAWNFVTTMALIAAVGLTTLGILATFRWWDSWRFREVKQPSVEGRFVVDEAGYDRRTLVEVLVAHQRMGSGGCLCGWDVLGASWADHVADEYEEARHG